MKWITKYVAPQACYISENSLLVAAFGLYETILRNLQVKPISYTNV
jgi:hypothetical protein